MTRASTTPLPQCLVRNPAILAGKPVVRGTRTSVEVVLEYLAYNPSFDELFADYPRLTMNDVQACFEYAHSRVQESARHREAATMPT